MQGEECASRKLIRLIRNLLHLVPSLLPPLTMEDAESIRQALLALKKTAAELQQEWAEAHLAADIQDLETEVLEESAASEVRQWASCFTMRRF